MNLKKKRNSNLGKVISRGEWHWLTEPTHAKVNFPTVTVYSKCNTQLISK